MSAHAAPGSRSAALRAIAAAVLALACLAAFGAARATAEATDPDRPPSAAAEGDDVRATVSVLQEDDIYDASPGMDYRARMAWSSTGEVRRGKAVSGVRGEGAFTANVDATYPAGDPCGTTTHFLAASGDVEESTDLSFRFIPRDIRKPQKGLAGWFIHTPTARWKGDLTTVKPELCGGTTSEEGGSWFAAYAFAGGTERAGGFPMAAPKVTITAAGEIRVSGKAEYASGTTRQMVDFTVTCASANACFGRPPTGTNGLEIGWRYLGATCVPNIDNGTFRLTVKVRMRVENGETSLLGNKWASGMRAEARLEPAKTGLQFTRDWRKKAVRPLLPEKSYDERITIVTDNVASGGEWRLHVRYVWEIPLARDVIREFVSPASKPIDC